MKGRPQLTVAEQGRLVADRGRQYALQSVFKYGYRNKEDVSNLPPNVLVLGSQNVLTNAAELVGIRQGYVLDGDAGDQNDYGVDSSYDFETRLGGIENLRKWGTNLEVRYEYPDSTVDWINILTTLNADKVANFTPYWDQSRELKRFCLFVNGDNKVYEWSGGIGAYASVTPVSGAVTAMAVNSGGTGYATGDTLTITGGNGDATAIVLTQAGGVIQTIALTNPGSGYSTTSGAATTSSGSGINATIDITAQTAYTVVVSGNYTLSQLGFYDNYNNASKFEFLDKNGNTYSYLAVSGNSFLGVLPDPTAAFAVGDPIIQKPTYRTGASIVATTGSPNTYIGTSYIFDLISTLKNQVWYGSLTSPNIYVSKTDAYYDCSFSSPARLPSEGALIILDACPTALLPEGADMYASAGLNQWWRSLETDSTVVVSTVATPVQALSMQRIKTAFNQAAQSQALTGNYKNSIIYVSGEPIVNALGLVKDIYAEPQVVNLSDPIKFDVDAYDFTGGSIFYDNYYIYVAIPANNVVRMYNVQKNYWEAPQVLPVSRFYHVVNSEGQTVLYGHSALTNESYELFTGYSDNGNPINAIAAFPYVSSLGAAVDMLKSFNKIYTEGYIAANTDLILEINYDFGGFSGTYTTDINGSDDAIIFNEITDGSLGRNPLGSQPLGTILNLPLTPVTPKFRSIKTMPRKDCFEYQIVYSTNQVDAQWTLLRFGPAISGSQAIPTSITE